MRRAVGCGVALALVTCVEVAGACKPARTTQDLSQLEPAWSEALLELVDASRDPAQPWGCPNATLFLDTQGEGRELRVERSGAPSISRKLDVPDDVVVMGKAMLARPLETPAPPPVPAPSYVAPDVPDEEEEEEEPSARGYVEAHGAMRYAGITKAIAMGGGGRGTIPIGRWSIGFGARYVLMAADVGNRTAAQDFEYNELTIYGGVGYALVTEPVRLRVGLNAALALVDLDLDQQVPGESELEVESGAVDGRLGTELRLTVPIWNILSFAASIDAELSPASLVDSNRRVDPELPPLPGYTIGTALGLEVAIP